MYDSWLVRHGFQGDGACQLYSYSWDGAFFFREIICGYAKKTGSLWMVTVKKIGIT